MRSKPDRDIIGRPEMSDHQFEQVSRLVKSQAGINLHEGKKELAKARLTTRLRVLGLPGFNDYLHYLASDRSGHELVEMLDAISTNLTGFFREPVHFDYLRQVILPHLQVAQSREKRLRIWSAGCSTGEEAYSIAMALCEGMTQRAAWDVRILATDLSTHVLRTAADGVYTAERLESLPEMMVPRYFTPIVPRPRDHEPGFRVRPVIRDLLTFGRLNLMESWPMVRNFNVVFCRNVMIYFDKPTQEKLVNRFYDMLVPGGTLFIGHSESLTNITHDFQYVQPTVYEKH